MISPGFNVVFWRIFQSADSLLRPGWLFVSMYKASPKRWWERRYRIVRLLLGDCFKEFFSKFLRSFSLDRVSDSFSVLSLCWDSCKHNTPEVSAIFMYCLLIMCCSAFWSCILSSLRCWIVHLFFWLFLSGFSKMEIWWREDGRGGFFGNSDLFAII